jgi:peptidoglycan/LPS O-acetylase OafA/YrhL
MTPTSTSKANYRPDIDGLRALAVLSVLFYHAHLGFPGGYVGVDIFFVISGYLITGLVWRDIRAGTFSLRNFWVRRVRRLLPALAVMTALTFAVGFFLLIPRDLKDLSGALVSQPLLVVNVFYSRVVQGGYFGDPPEIRPLLHTWSLGLEEQFYVLFPLALLAVARFTRSDRHVNRGLLATCVLSFALCAWLTPIKLVFSFFCLPTRAWELLLGGVLATLPPLSRFYGRDLVSLGSGVYLLYRVNHGGDLTQFPGFEALSPCLATVFLIATGPDALFNRCLKLPVLVATGLISYSLYLWHWPIVAYLSYYGQMDTLSSKLSVVLASFLLGYLSWRFVEQPFRSKKICGTTKHLMVFLLLYSGSSLVIGATLWNRDGLPHRWPAPPPPPSRDHIWEFDPKMERVPLPVLGDARAPATTFLLWGDSHAMALAEVLDVLGREYKIKGLQLTRSSTAPLVTLASTSAVGEDQEQIWMSKAVETVKKERIRYVFVAGAWGSYVHNSLADEIAQTRDSFKAVGAQLLFIEDVPLQISDPWKRVALERKWELPYSPLTRAEHEEQSQSVIAALSTLRPEDRLNPAPILLQQRTFLSGEHCIYADEGHISDEGSLLLRPVFEPSFRRWASSPAP